MHTDCQNVQKHSMIKDIYYVKYWLNKRDHKTKEHVIY